MKNEDNSLTKNEKYTSLLYIIGKSPKHLSRDEIKKSMSKADIIKNEQQVYEMIENLNSFLLDKYGICLFNWKEIIKDAKQQMKTLYILKKYFELDWTEDHNEKNAQNKKSHYVNFKKVSEKEISVKNIKEPHKEIKIVKDVFGIIGELIIVSGENERKVKVYRKGDFIYLSNYDLKNNIQISLTLDHFYKDPPRFLDTKLDEKAEKDLHFLLEKNDDLSKQKNSGKETANLFSQIIAITENRKLLRYHFNTRGFLLYIVGELELEKNNNRSYNRRIRIILKNLSIHYTDNYPFLEFYNEFRKEFTKLKETYPRYEYLEVELIKEIAFDLQNQFQHTDINFLNYYITKKYSTNIIYNILDLIKQGFLSNSDRLVNILRTYQLKNLEYLKTYLNKEMNLIEDHYNFLYINKEQIEIIKRTNSFIDGALQINY